MNPLKVFVMGLSGWFHSHLSTIVLVYMIPRVNTIQITCNQIGTLVDDMLCFLNYLYWNPFTCLHHQCSKFLIMFYILKKIAKKKSPGVEVIFSTLVLRIGNGNHLLQLNVEVTNNTNIEN